LWRAGIGPGQFYTGNGFKSIPAVQISSKNGNYGMSVTPNSGKLKKVKFGGNGLPYLDVF